MSQLEIFFWKQVLQVYMEMSKWFGQNKNDQQKRAYTIYLAKS